MLFRTSLTLCSFRDYAAYKHVFFGCFQMKPECLTGQVFFCAVMPLFIVPIIHITDMGNKHLGKWQKIQTFITAPITKFCYNMVSLSM